MFLSLAVGFSLLQDKPQPQYDMGIVQLVFFIEAKNPMQMTDSRMKKMQAGHLKFLEKLSNERKALLVGPFVNGGKYRGLIVLNLKTRDEALALLKKDPWISSGAMDLEPYGWFTARNVPQRGPKFSDLETLWFGFLRRPADAPVVDDKKAQEIQAGHMANINAMAESGDLVLAGPIEDKGDFRGIFIFRTKQKSKIEELVARDPAIKMGRLRLELIQWKTTKGTFPSK